MAKNVTVSHKKISDLVSLSNKSEKISLHIIKYIRWFPAYK